MSDNALMRIRPKNVLIGVLVAAVIFVACVWYAPVPLILSILESPQTSLQAGFTTTISLLAGSFGDIPYLDLSYFAAMAVLIGLNVALTLEYLQRRRPDAGGYTGLVGMVAALTSVLGFGCAACGSLLAGWALGAFGLGWLLTFLPFGGEELRFVGIALLLLSAYLTIRNLRNPAVCPV